jgi:hypothetical protein
MEPMLSLYDSNVIGGRVNLLPETGWPKMVKAGVPACSIIV